MKLSDKFEKEIVQKNGQPIAIVNLWEYFEIQNGEDEKKLIFAASEGLITFLY